MNAAPPATADLITGVTLPVITPLCPGPDGRLRPDADLMLPLLQRVAAAGITRIMLYGSNGEGPLIPTSLLGDFAIRVAADWRAISANNTVVINITAPGTAEALLRAGAAAPAQPDAYVCSPPIYFRHRDDEVVEHFGALADLDAPVIIYNSPKYSTPLTQASLAPTLGLPHVVGIKDSSGDLDQLELIIKTAADSGVRVGQGDETKALQALRLGADGLVLGIANIAPRPVLDLWHAHLDGREFDAEAAQELITALVGIHRIRPGVPTVKAILAAYGIGSTAVMPPLLPCTDSEATQLRDYLVPYEQQLIMTDPTQADNDPDKE